MNLLALVSAVLLTASTTVTADVVLNENIMNLAQQAGNLSALAYKENPPGDEYENFGYFDEEPDQALVAKINGYCFGAFRGTTLTWDDWSQNFNPGKQDVCQSNDPSNCCVSRSGFFDGYYTGEATLL
jgi:hypothetical protein